MMKNQQPKHAALFDNNNNKNNKICSRKMHILHVRMTWLHMQKGRTMFKWFKDKEDEDWQQQKSFVI